MKNLLSTLACLFFLSIFSFAQTTKTVGSGGDYNSLKLAFDAINAGSITGSITLQVISSISDNNSAVLNASGSGAANYTAVSIYPTGAGYTVSSDLNAAFISFNGASNVTIDGRVNATGSTNSLVITNVKVATSASTFKFSNSAQNNTIQYCTIKGATTNSSGAVIFFSSSNAGTGNDNNLIDHNNITSDAAGRPVNVIYSAGSAGRENSENTISNNNIYDFLPAGYSGRGVNMASNSSSWTISGNSFYETTTIVPTANNNYNVISINTSVNHLISGNYIGGAAPQCGGSAFTVNSSFAHFFYAIYVSGGSTTPVTVQNNIIQNINYTSTCSNPWDGIYLAYGNTNTDIIGNTIGATTGTNSIIITTPNAAATATISGGIVTAINIIGGGTGFTAAPLISFSSSGSTTAATATAIISGGIVTGYNITNGGVGYTAAPSVMFNASSYSTSHGIRHLSIGTVTIQNNNIGAITTVGNAYYSHCLEPIVISGGASTISITNNLIGSASTANSLQTSSAATSSLSKQDLRGIYLNSIVPTATISGNTIANLTNYYAGTIASKLDGICTSGGSNTIQNNTIRNLSTSSASIAIKGIQQVVTAAGTSQTVTGNTIYNLSHTNTSSAAIVQGIQFMGSANGTNSVSGNFIYGLSTASSNTNAEIDGISLGDGVNICANNIINLGSGISTGNKIYGISDFSNANVSNNNNIYFNSVYISGTVASGVTSSTAALWNFYNTATRNYRNNVLVNVRTGGTTGNHYAIRVAGPSGLTINYNDYYFSGTYLGYISGSDKSSLALWKTGTGQDVNSMNIDPGFVNAGGTDPMNYNTTASLPGVTGTGISTDYHGITRAATPKMGALETNGFIWQGSISNDFGTAGNWVGGIVPPADADISFAASPNNDCVLDQDRVFDDITNAQSTYQLKANGKKLTIDGQLYFTNAAKIDATAINSIIAFAGIAAQQIPTGAFVSNSIEYLTINNSNGLTLNGNLLVAQTLSLNAGAFSIGANTLTLNGTISTGTGILTGGNSSNLVLGGTTATSLPAINLNNLTINRSGGITMSGAVNITGVLALTAGTLTVAANTLTIAGTSPTRTSGFIDVSHASATIDFANTTAIVLPASLFSAAINNLSITGTGGITAGADLTVNGILNLAAINPSSTKGLLEMTIDYTGYPGTSNSTYLNSYILNMGSSATTIGNGDVTGTIKRATILANTPYTFGHQYTTVSLTAGNMPTALSVTVTMGSSPVNNPDAAKRTYEIVPDVPGGFTSTSHVTANFHYLESELTSSISPYHVNTEATMVTMDYDIGGGFSTPDEHGRSTYDFTNNYIGLSNIPISYFINIPGHAWRTLFQLRDFINGYYTWDGSSSSDWGTSANWTPTGVPSDVSHVIIPDAATTPNDPILAPNVIINTLTIENGGILTMGSDTLTIKNSLSGGWEDQNPAGNDPGTSTVIFSMPGTTISGNARFYNVVIGAGADISNQAGSIMKIANSITRSGSGKWYADIFDATVEYNGANQTILITDATPYYHNLILSGSGNVSIPSSLTTLHGNLTIGGTVNATANAAMTINGNLNILAGASFNTGNYNHVLKGNFENNGTLNAAAGYGITMNGTVAQSILGTVTTSFDDLTINNSAGVGIYSNVTVNDVLDLAAGHLIVTDVTLGINGSISKTTGSIETSPTASLSFGGTTALSLANNLFSNTPTINNLSINRSGGVNLGNQDMIVNGLLSLTAGRFNIGANQLTLAGSSPTRGTGDINASTTNAGIIFSGTSQQEIPSGLFYNDEVYNLTINNTSHVLLSGSLRLLNTLNCTAGMLDASTNSVTVVYAGANPQNILANQYLNDRIYNLTIDNAAGVILGIDFTVGYNLLINTGKLLQLDGNIILTVH